MICSREFAWIEKRRHNLNNSCFMNHRLRAGAIVKLSYIVGVKSPITGCPAFNQGRQIF